MLFFYHMRIQNMRQPIIFGDQSFYSMLILSQKPRHCFDVNNIFLAFCMQPHISLSSDKLIEIKQNWFIFSFALMYDVKYQKLTKSHALSAFLVHVIE